MSDTESSLDGPAPADDLPASKDFAVCVTDAQSALYCYICNLLGNARDARDVLQETNLVILRKESQFDFQRPFMPWAFRVAHFQVLSHRKKHATERLLFSDDVLEKIAIEATSFVDKIDERSVAIDECVPKLPSSQRDIVLEHYQEGQSVQSIAARKGKSENAISAILYRARRALVRCVQQVLARKGLP